MVSGPSSSCFVATKVSWICENWKHTHTPLQLQDHPPDKYKPRYIYIYQKGFPPVSRLWIWVPNGPGRLTNAGDAFGYGYFLQHASHAKAPANAQSQSGGLSVFLFFLCCRCLWMSTFRRTFLYWGSLLFIPEKYGIEEIV